MSKSHKYFQLAFLQIMMHQLQLFCMIPSNRYWLLKDLIPLLLTIQSFERFTFSNTHVNTIVSNNISNKIQYLYRLLVSFLVLSYYFNLIIFTQFCSASSDCLSSFQTFFRKQSLNGHNKNHDFYHDDNLAIHFNF